MHMGLCVLMGACFWQWVALYTVFVPWASIFRSLSRRMESIQSSMKPKVLFDGQCPMCIRSMTTLSYFDWFDRISYSDFNTLEFNQCGQHFAISPDDLQREMHLVLPHGSIKKGFFAFREILKRMPLLWPLLILFYFPGAAIIGPKLYWLVASNRTRNQSCTYESCPVHPILVTRRLSDK